MPFTKYLNNGNTQTAPAISAGASSDYNPFAKYAEDQQLLNRKLKTDVLGLLSSDTGIKNVPLDLDYSKYQDYGIYLTDKLSQEEIDKERAKNQSALEQTGRALVNTAAEVVLGIPIGFADILDAVVNIANEDNDYQNAFTAELTEWKEAINERMKVYQENPNEALNFSDWGWYMTHAPSIISSLTLMVPGYGYTKAVSGLGKLTKLNKVANKFARYRNLTQKTKDTIGAIGSAASQGSIMRIGENYIEARDTYNTVEQNSLNELSRMSAKEKAEFLANNPKYEGMDDEAIAKDIAANSADVTFNTDLINGFFDIIQIYGLRNIWNNRITNGFSSANLRRLNKAAASNFSKDAASIAEAAKPTTLWGKTKNTLANIAEDTITLGRTEWTEGVEEAINYIASQEGIYAGTKVFDKDAKPTELQDYLRDPYLWESALWGVIGGVVFGQAYPAAVKGIEKLNAKRLGKEWISAEKQQEAEILSRAATTQEYINQLDAIKQLQNPFDDNSSIEASDVETLKDLATKKYIDKLVINAANAGNLNFLESFMHDKNFTKGITEKLGLNEAESADILAKFDQSLSETKDLYNDIILRANRFGASFEEAKLIATDGVDLQHSINNWRALRDNAQRKLDGIVAQDHIAKNVESYLEDAKDGIVLTNIERRQKHIESFKNHPTFTEKQKIEAIQEAESDIRIYKQLRPVENFTEEQVKDKKAAAVKLVQEQKEVYEAFMSYASKEARYLYANEAFNVTDEYIKDRITYYDNIFKDARIKIVNGALADMTAMYRKYGKAEVDKYRANKESAIEEADKKLIDNAITALALDSKGNEFLNSRLDEIGTIADIEKEKAKKDTELEDLEKEAKESTVGAKTQEEVDKELEEQNKDKVAPPPPPTGGQPKADPVAPPQDDTPPQDEPPVGDDIQLQSNDFVTPAITIPQDEEEQIDLAEEIANNIIGQLPAEYVTNQANETDAIKRVAEELKKIGFAEDISEFQAGIVVKSHNGNLAYSSSIIKDDLNIAPRIIHYSAYNDVAILEKALKEFVNTEFNGKRYGREFEGNIYISLSELMAYLSDKLDNPSMVKILYNSLKSYLFSDQNKTVILTDEATIAAIDKYNINDYIILYKQVRDRRVKNLSNEVNLATMFDGTDEQIAKNIVEFSKITKDTSFSVEYAESTERIYVRRAGKDIGYMGTAYEFDGKFARTNENWLYEIDSHANGTISSPLLNWFLNIVTNDDANNDVLNEIRSFDKNLLDIAKQFGEDTIPKFENLGMYDEGNGKYDVYYQAYADFTDYLISIGAGEFIQDKEGYADLSTLEKAIAANHFFKIAKLAVIVRDSDIIYDWFDHLYGSYDMAQRLVNNPSKKVKVNRVLPGLINTEQTTNYEGNPIDDAVVGYDENIHQLGVVIGPPGGERQVIFSKSAAPVLADKSLSSTQNIVIKIPRPDGTNAYALCKQTPIGQLKGNPVVNEIIENVILESGNIVNRFFSTQGTASFDELEKRLSDLFSNNGLIKGIYINRLKSGVVTVNVKDSAGQAKTLFFFNPPAQNYAKNMAHKYGSKGKDLYYASTSTQAASTFRTVIRDTLYNDINCTFAVGTSTINDGFYDDIKNNIYVYREGGKTKITVGKYAGEFNSYQEFLVKNGLIKTKLKNDKTPRVVAPGVIAYGNYVYSKSYTGLEVRLPMTVRKISATYPKVEEVTDLLNVTPTNADIESVAEEINNPENFKDYLKNAADAYNVKADTAINFYEEILATGILNLPIDIDNTNRHKALAYYNPAVGKMYLVRPRLLKAFDKGEVRMVRLINNVIHENIHGYIDQENKRTNGEMSKKITSAFKPIYDEYIAWFNQQSEDFKENENNRYLARIKKDGTALEDIDYEEFMIESMTNGTFMKQLNSIETTTTNAKKTTLFAKIMEIIANLFGIKINSNSLLAKAQAAAQSLIEEENSSVNEQESNDNVGEESKGESEEEIRSIQQNSSNEEKPIDLDNTVEEGSNSRKYTRGRRKTDEKFPFSAATDVLTINESIERLPYSVQARFASLLDEGTIGFHCR